MLDLNLTSKSNPQLPALTGLRAIAAYLVFFHHFPISSDYVGGLGYNILWQGHVGVGIFFVLSGFLIAFNYSGKLVFTTRSILQYLQNRFAKIYPIYVFATSVTLIYIKDFNLKSWFLNLTLFRGFFGDWYFYHIGQAWSLTVELCFYVLAPILLLLVGRIPIGLICLGFYFLGYVFTFIEMPIDRFLDPPRMLVVNTFFGRCFEFLLGIWLYKNYQNYEKKGFNWITYTGFLLLVLFQYVSAGCYGLTVYSPYYSPAHHYVFPLIVGILIFGLWKENTIISKILSSRIFIVLGKSSYAFYLIHAAPFKEMLGLEGSPILLHFVCINLLAISCFYFIENPLHKLLKAKKRS